MCYVLAQSKRPFQEQIGDYAVNFYVVDGLKLVTRKRREHLSPEDVHKNKTLIKSLTTGSAVSDEEYKVRSFHRQFPKLLLQPRN